MALAGRGGVTLSGAGPGGVAALGGPGGVAGLIEDENMVNLAQVEGQMRASSLRKLSEIVEKHPDETLTILRGWMAQENA
jgi:flagellar M-ring protein FliF